jgi:hypothetical protein
MGLSDKGLRHLRERRQRSRSVSRMTDAVAMKGAPGEQGAFFASPRAQGLGEGGMTPAWGMETSYGSSD